jgi:glycosyltransferase involved in cell wall biosynthesis
MNQRALVISAYPLTAGYRDTVGRSTGGGIEFVTVADLRSRGIRALARQAIRHRVGRVIIASESASSTALEPALLVFGTLLGASAVCTAGPDGVLHAQPLSARLLSSCRLASASADCLFARIVARCRSIASRGFHAQFDCAFDSWDGRRVLYIKNTLSTGVRAGGSVGHVSGVVNALADAGAEVRLVTTEPSPMLSPSVRETHPSGMEVFGLPSQANIFRMQRQTIRRGLEVAAEWKPDLIYQRLTLGDFSGAVLSESLGVPLLTEYNGSEVWCNQHWGAGVRYPRDFIAAEETMFRRSSLVFTISKVLHSELIARGVPPHRAGWYPNGIDPAIYNPERFSPADLELTRRELGVGLGEYVVTFVGTFGDWHGADVFARAAAEGCAVGGVLEHLPIRFLFIGDGKNRAMAESIVRSSNASSRCTFTGLVPQSRTPAMLAASDCFVSPHVPNPDGTEFFGSPTKLFEYMAMGKPIVASRLGQIAEVLSHGQTAVLVQAGDAAELAASIAALTSDRAGSAELGRRARAHAMSRYTWARHVDAMLDCLCISGNRVSRSGR